MTSADEDEGVTRPSKSERKRVAHAAQELGEALIKLREAELLALNLPEQLTDAIRDARRITERGGAARQRQYIGKLMREIDPEPIRAALQRHSELSAREAELFKRAESWRDRLVTEGEAALEELHRWRPGIDCAAWLPRIRAAQARDPGAARELFRALRALFAGEP